MSTQSDAVPESGFDPVTIAGAIITPTRPLYWSVQRELWENRSIYIAPIAAAAVMLFGFLISTIHLPQSMRAALALDAAHQSAEISKPYNVVAFLILVTAFIVGVFYCLDALHGERRDRSILFWKSLPVSDFTTVLSKASIPIVVLPLLIFPIIFATRLIMLLLSTAVLQANGINASTLWRQLKFWESSAALLYGLIVIALWHAPIYGWLLLVSGWARRTAFLWALLPPVGLCIVEKIAFNTSHFASLLQYRLVGWFAQAFAVMSSGNVPLNPLATLAPGKFLTTPGLWTGLAATAIFLAAAARVRRSRGPI